MQLTTTATISNKSDFQIIFGIAHDLTSVCYLWYSRKKSFFLIPSEDGFILKMHFLCTTCYIRSFTVKVIAHPDNSTSFEVIESQLENPLIDAKHRDLFNMKQIPIPVGHHHRTHHKRNQTDDFERESLIRVIILLLIK